MHNVIDHIHVYNVFLYVMLCNKTWYVTNRIILIIIMCTEIQHVCIYIRVSKQG